MRTRKIQALTQVTQLSYAARAECLRQIRENRAYQATGLNWDEYCPTHLGITRSQADRIIRRLEQFGERDFDLSKIAPILAASKQGIEIDGEIVPLTPENAPRIRRAVAALRAALRRAHEMLSTSSVTELLSVSTFRHGSRQAGHRLNAPKQAELGGLIHYAINKLRELRATFPDLRQ